MRYASHSMNDTVREYHLDVSGVVRGGHAVDLLESRERAGVGRAHLVAVWLVESRKRVRDRLDPFVQRAGDACLGCVRSPVPVVVGVRLRNRHRPSFGPRAQYVQVGDVGNVDVGRRAAAGHVLENH